MTVRSMLPQLLDHKILGKDSLRRYQLKAINEWINNSCRGILRVATGCGKTIIAIAAIRHLLTLDGHYPHFVIITVPQTHLANQWSEELRKYEFKPLICHSGVFNWDKKLRNDVLRVKGGVKKVSVVVVTISSFIREKFLSLVDADLRTLLISDEAHNVGANETRKHLPTQITYRMGLTASPDRLFDQPGNQFLQEFFGGTIFTYSLAEAIKEEYLVPYDYKPQLTVLANHELETYESLSKRIALLQSKLKREKDPVKYHELEEEIKDLMINRQTRIVNAEEKLDLLPDIIKPFTTEGGLIVFCSPQQFKEVGNILSNQNILYRSLHYKNHTMTERVEILKAFEKGLFKVLVAINLLSEGVNLPSVRTAIFLASSTNPREYIQRRGRILRLFPNKTKATVIDFIVAPPLGAIDPMMDGESEPYQFMINEFDRALVFASDSLAGFLSLKPFAHLLAIPYFHNKHQLTIEVIKNH